MGSKYWMRILTVSWWRWVFAHGNAMALHRIKTYYRLHIKYPLRRPICWLIGHNDRQVIEWGYHGFQCYRCHHWAEYVKHETVEKP